MTVICFTASLSVSCSTMPTEPQVITAGGAAKIKDTSNSSTNKRKTRTKQKETGPFDQNDNDAPPFPPPSQTTASSAVQQLQSQPQEFKSKPVKDSAFMSATLPEPKLEEEDEMDNDVSKQQQSSSSQRTDLVWLLLCFLGIMASFVCYGLLLEYTTSGGRHLHELSFLFVTSSLYTITAAAGRYVRDETPTTIPPARFAILGLTSMGSTFCSVRSLRYVIYPIQVLAKSCKPVPVMLMGALMGKRYPPRKYVNVCLIVLGVALFMGGGDNKKKSGGEEGSSSGSQILGILLLFVSLCFDGGTGAYEDKLMSVHSVQPFDLMYNIQLGKTILAGVSLLVLNQVHVFLAMIQEMGFLLLLLGLSGAMGQVFIFITISKFGALTCSIIGLARKVTTLVASIYFYGHSLNGIQFSGLLLSVVSMVMNFWGKKKNPPPPPADSSEETQELVSLVHYTDEDAEDETGGNVELVKDPKESAIV